MDTTRNVTDKTGVKTPRTAERTEFLTYIFDDAINHCGYGWFTVDAYHAADDTTAAYAIITEMESDEPDTYRVDIGTVARGLGVIRRAFYATSADRSGRDGTYLHNADTFEPLGIGGEPRDMLMLADKSNGEDGDYDVVSALAALECGIFGRVMFG